VRCAARCLRGLAALSTHVEAEVCDAGGGGVGGGGDRGSSMAGLDALSAQVAWARARVSHISAAVVETHGALVHTASARAVDLVAAGRLGDAAEVLRCVVSAVRAMLSNAASHQGKMRKAVSSCPEETGLAGALYTLLDAACSAVPSHSHSHSDVSSALRVSLSGLALVLFKVARWRTRFRSRNPTRAVLAFASTTQSAAAAVPTDALANLARACVNAGIVDAELKDKDLRRRGEDAVAAWREWHAQMSLPTQQQQQQPRGASTLASLARTLGNETLATEGRMSDSCPVAFAARTATELAFLFLPETDGAADGADGDLGDDGQDDGHVDGRTGIDEPATPAAVPTTSSAAGQGSITPSTPTRLPAPSRNRRRRLNRKLRRRRAAAATQQLAADGQITASALGAAAGPQQIAPPPGEFLCAIDGHLIDEAVVSVQGVCFDRACAERVAEGADAFLCPVTGETVLLDELIEDESLAAEIAAYKFRRACAENSGAVE
jgi:hypothetical protein